GCRRTLAFGDGVPLGMGRERLDLHAHGTRRLEGGAGDLVGVTGGGLFKVLMLGTIIGRGNVGRGNARRWDVARFAGEFGRHGSRGSVAMPLHYRAGAMGYL